MTEQEELKAQFKHQLETVGVEIMKMPFVLRRHVGSGSTTVNEKEFEFSMSLSAGGAIFIERADTRQCVRFSVETLNKMANAMGLYD